MRQVIRLTESDLHRIVKESVRKALNEINEDGKMYYKGQIFSYKGDYDAKQKKAYLRWRKAIDDAELRERGEEVQEPEKPKRTIKSKTVDDAIGEDQASPKALALNVKNLLYDKALKTIFVFVWHGDISFKREQINRIHSLYKGANFKDRGVDPLNKFNTIYRNIEVRIKDIENWGKKNEHAVYNKVFEIAYLLEDMNDLLTTLCKITMKLKQENKFAEFTKSVDPQTGQVVVNNRPPVLYGRGGNREYGLFGLAFASPQALDNVQSEILKNINMLKDISKNGRNPMDYDPNDLRKKE